MYRYALLPACALLIALTGTAIAATNDGLRYAGDKFTIDYSSRMLGREYRLLLFRTYWRCAYTCGKEPRCRAFSHNRLSGSCSLIATVSRQRRDWRYVTGVRIDQAPHARPVRIGKVALEFGQQRDGRGYRSLYVDQAQECARHCDRETQCAAFRYQPDTRRCTLLSKASPAKPRPGMVSGLKQRPTGGGLDSKDNGSGFLIHRNTLFEGDDYRHAEATTSSNCRQQCADDPGCAAFSWQPFSAMCYLKSQRPTARYRKGVVSGVKQSPSR